MRRWLGPSPNRSGERDCAGMKGSAGRRIERGKTQRYKVYEFGKNSHCRTKKKNFISGSEFWFPKCITLTISSCIEFSTMDRGQTKKDSRSLKQEANNTCHVPQHVISLPLQDTCVLAVLLQIHTLLRKPVQTYCME